MYCVQYPYTVFCVAQTITKHIYLVNGFLASIFMTVWTNRTLFLKSMRVDCQLTGSHQIAFISLLGFLSREDKIVGRFFTRILLIYPYE